MKPCDQSNFTGHVLQKIIYIIFIFSFFARIKYLNIFKAKLHNIRLVFREYIFIKYIKRFIKEWFTQKRKFADILLTFRPSKM